MCANERLFHAHQKQKNKSDWILAIRVFAPTRLAAVTLRPAPGPTQKASLGGAFVPPPPHLEAIGKLFNFFDIETPI